MSGSINMEFGGDNARAIRAMAELEAANAVLTGALKTVQREAEKAGNQQEASAKRAAAAVEKLKERNAALEARLAEVGKKTGAVTADYEKMQRETVALSRANDQLIRDNERLTAGMQGVGTAAVSAGARGRTAMESVLTGARGAVGMLLGGSGLLAALGLVTKSLDDLEARGKAASNASTTVEGAEASVANNIPSTGDPAKDAAITADVIARGRAIASARQVPVLDVMNAIAGGLSASGGDIEATLGATDLQAELNRANPSEMMPGVEGTVNVARIMGTQNATAAQGVLELIGANSAIREPGKISESVTPVLTTAAAFGFDINQVGAFFSTLTKEQADKTGERSRTATISFVEQLSTFFREGGGKRLDDAAVRDRGQGLNFAEMIATLQDDAALREEFQSGLSLDKPAVGPVKQLLEDMYSSFSESMFNAMANTPVDEAGMEALVAGRRARLGAVPSVVVGDASRALAAAGEQSMLGDVSAQAAGIFSSTELDKQLSAAGLQLADRAIANLRFKTDLLLGVDPQNAFSQGINDARESFAAGDPEATRSRFTKGTNAEVLARLERALQASAMASEKVAAEMERARQGGNGAGSGATVTRQPVRNP